MTPRVLVDATPLRADSGYRGIGRYIRDLLHGLSKTRSEWENSLRIAALGDLDLDGRAVISEDLIEVAESAFSARGTRRAGLKWSRRLLLDRVVRREGAALLHITEAVGTPLRTSVPILVTCHDMIPLHYPTHYVGGPIRSRIRLARERRRYARPEHVVAISERTARDLIEIVGVPRARIDVVLHGIDLGLFLADRASSADQQTLEKLGLRSKRFVVYAGGSDWRKNIGRMMQALSVARRSVDVELAWAGHPEAQNRHKVKAAIRDARVENAVKILGFVDEADMPALFRCARAHLFLSRLEGFGLSVAEAMAAGCPVIVARGSCSDEIAGDGGVIVDPDDVEAAARAIVEMTNDPRARARQIARGKARALHFDRERMALDYAKLYAKLVRDLADPARDRPDPARA